MCATTLSPSPVETADGSLFRGHLPASGTYSARDVWYAPWDAHAHGAASVGCLVIDGDPQDVYVLTVPVGNRHIDLTRSETVDPDTEVNYRMVCGRAGRPETCGCAGFWSTGTCRHLDAVRLLWDAGVIR
jgi:hypothetical protein